MSDLNTDQLITITKKVFKSLVKEGGNDTLSRQEILDILGEELEHYYSLIVSGLIYIEKATKRIGRSGGIQFTPGKGKQKKIVTANEGTLRYYFDSVDLSDYELDLTEKIENLSEEEEQEKEQHLYEPTRLYLSNEVGIYESVEIVGNARPGKGKWKNPDLAGLKYTPSLKFHSGIFPRTTAFEVKYFLPDIQAFQQTASYFRFFNSSYLCYLDKNYHGSDTDKYISNLKDSEIWSWCDLYEIGLIVIFFKTTRSSTHSFQTLRDSKEISLTPELVEESIETYFSEKTKNSLRKAVKEQIKSLL